MIKFELPEWATGLRVAPDSQIDLRSEAEIIQELPKAPFDLPHQIKTSWSVRIVDLTEGSPNNIYNYLHAAHLVRLSLLFEYGGVWMEVGNMLHTHLDPLFWNHLIAPDSPYEMAAWIISGQPRKQWGSFGNYMLAARRRCFFLRIGTTPTKNFDEMSDYVVRMLMGDQPRNLLDLETGRNGREVFEKKIFMVEGILYGMLGAMKTDFDGARQVELFTTRFDDPDGARRWATEAFVVDTLENSHMYNVYHNSAGGLPALGDLVEKGGFQDADHRPGRFVHRESTRGAERLIPQPAKEEMIRAAHTIPAARRLR
ncbi:hypothetical protein GGR53DRAFT_521135 [Hypoxylon sp. FL1150]|nr:hypothetical protein GGR53DRAFT_521135 [Hypoxylon sp. FL1150]